MNDQSREERGKEALRHVLDAVVEDHGLPVAWEVVDGWLTDHVEDLAGLLSRDQKQRLRVRNLQLAAQRIAGAKNPRVRRRAQRGS